MRDTNTRLLAQKASDDFFALTGKRPYLIIAEGSRDYIDFNRDKSLVPNNAYDDPLAEPYYDYYHGMAQGFIDDIRAEYGRGLMLDIHGQSTIPDLNIRGTKNGLTTVEMRNIFGSDPTMNGPNSIFGSLAALGYPVDPSIAVPFENQVENPSFDGGFTVQNYGSHQPSGIDAIQVEFGIDFRGGSGGTEWQQTASDLAIALSNFYSTYLVLEPGDTNADGRVDGQDFLAWQKGFGIASGAAITDGDTNGDQIVDGHDLLVWQNHFGNGIGGLAQASGVSVPEPSAIALLLFAVIGYCSWRVRLVDTKQSTLVPTKLQRGFHPMGWIGLLALPGVVSTSLPSQAEVLTFTNQAAWEAALTGQSSLEDFEGAGSDLLFGLAYQPKTSPNGELVLHANANFATNASIDVAPFLSNGAGIHGDVVVNLRFLDQGNNTNSQETVVVTLPAGMSAFAFEYLNYDNQGDTTLLRFTGTNGQQVASFNPGSQGNQQFFGVVDTTPGAEITSFAFSGDPSTGSGSSAFNSFDDVRYGVGLESLAGTDERSTIVPEPSTTWVLYGILLTAVGTRRRTRKPGIIRPRSTRGEAIIIQFDNN